MAASQCPHCGSKYITFNGKTESFEKTTENYYCQSCRKSFGVDLKKQSADGTWLMTIYDGEGFGSYRKELQIYKTENGYKLNQKQDDKFLTRAVRPKVKIQNNQYTHKYYLWFDTFTYFNDSDGCYLTATKVVMNQELAEKALKCEAMRIVHKGKNEFAIGNGYNETTLLRDIKAWFDEVLPAPTGDSSSSSGGCYVATAVYGSYDCPQVWTLRRFRDYTLAESRLGRLFVRAYYAISPTLVKWFGHMAWFTKLWRPVLDAMVNKLHEHGVEDTPYEDLRW